MTEAFILSGGFLGKRCGREELSFLSETRESNRKCKSSRLGLWNWVEKKKKKKLTDKGGLDKRPLGLLLLWK